MEEQEQRQVQQDKAIKYRERELLDKLEAKQQALQEKNHRINELQEELYQSTLKMQDIEEAVDFKYAQ